MTYQNLSEINRKINEDHNTVIKICDFLVKIFSGNTEAFKNCFQDSSNELLLTDDTYDTSAFLS